MRIKFEQSEQKLNGAIEHLKKELASIRAGRANISLVDQIRADVYGQKMPLNQLANINVVDATLITVQPWDKTNIDAIHKAILQENLGITPNVDGELIRLPLPPITEERRVEYVKLMKQKVEEARIAIRQIRKDILVGMEMDKKEKVLTEDDYNSKAKQLQSSVDKANEQVEELSQQKEEELMKV